MSAAAGLSISPDLFRRSLLSLIHGGRSGGQDWPTGPKVPSRRASLHNVELRGQPLAAPGRKAHADLLADLELFGLDSLGQDIALAVRQADRIRFRVDCRDRACCLAREGGRDGN